MLEKKEQEASNAFMYAKEGDKLAPLYAAQEAARKELREYKAWLYKGSGVNGNEI